MLITLCNRFGSRGGDFFIASCRSSPKGTHFRLVALRRLPDIGSDHFPMLAVFDYDPGSVINDAPEPEAGDKEEVDEAIAKGKAND